VRRRAPERRGAVIAKGVSLPPLGREPGDHRVVRPSRILPILGSLVSKLRRVKRGWGPEAPLTASEKGVMGCDGVVWSSL